MAVMITKAEGSLAKSTQGYREKYLQKFKICVVELDSVLLTNYFVLHIGVRQGENLFNDLKSYREKSSVEGITVKGLPNAEEHLKLLVLLYADDTDLLSDSARGLQNALYSLKQYCESWKLKVNNQKTKVMIFGCGRKTINCKFMSNDSMLKIVKTYKYLDVLFNQNGSFNKCKLQQKMQAEKSSVLFTKKNAES